VALPVEEDALPFHLGSLEVDQESDAEARSFQVIDPLRHMLISEAVNAFQFDDELFLNHQIGRVFSYTLAFVGNRKRDLSF
jgi:hypothetical protein